MTPKNLAKIIILWLSANILYTNINTLAQTPKYFWNTYGSDSLQEMGLDILMYNDSLFVINGVEFDPYSDAQKVLLWGINGKGNQVWRQSFGEYDGPHSALQMCLSPKRAVTFIFHYRPFYAGGTSFLHFVQVDSTGHTTQYKPVIDSVSLLHNVLYEIKNTQDADGYLLGGFSRDTTTTGTYDKPSLMKINEAGQVVWHQLYDNSFYPGNLNRISYSDDGGYYLSGYTNAIISNSTPYGDSFLIKADAQGKQQWQITKDWADNEGLGDLYEMADSTLVGYYIYENWDTTGFVPKRLERCSIVANFDKNLNMFWNSPCLCKNRGVVRLLRGDKQTWIGAGEYFDTENEWLRIELFKLDNQGNIIWQRFYGDDPEITYYVGDLGTLSDGSLIISGRVVGSSNNVPGASDMLLFKVNCMGLQTEPQAYFETEITETSNILRFHNLSTAVYPDSTDGGHFVWDFGDGNTSSLQNPEHSYDRSGTYRVVLKGIVCKDTSVYHQDIFVKVPPPANYQWQLSSLHNRQGALSLLYDIPQEGNHSFRLYDMLGREVLQQTLLSATRGAADIPLSALSAGSYVACLYKDNERIFIQKIILQ